MLAFYAALTKPKAIKEFYKNEELIAIKKEFADTLRKNRTIDQKNRYSARAKIQDSTGLIWDFHFKGITSFEFGIPSQEKSTE